MKAMFSPLYPPALSRPAGRERGLTALFGRVFKVNQFMLVGQLAVAVNVPALKRWPHMAVSSPLRPGGGGEGLGESGGNNN